MAEWVIVHKSKIRACNKCGEKIALVQNRNGKWFPVTLHGRNSGWGYETRKGNHKNWTPWHICRHVIAAEIAQANATIQRTQDQSVVDWYDSFSDEDKAKFSEATMEIVNQCRTRLGLEVVNNEVKKNNSGLEGPGAGGNPVAEEC